MPRNERPEMPVTYFQISIGESFVADPVAGASTHAGLV
jgi:hypothetical protein